MAEFFLGIWEREDAYAPGGDADFDGVMAAHAAFAEAVTAAGAKIVAGHALQPSPTAAFLRSTRTDDVTSIDNPLPELKEMLGGYYVIDTADEATATALAKLCPAPYGYIEMRPIWDFG